MSDFFRFLYSDAYIVMMQWLIGICMTVYGFASFLDEDNEEHPFQLMLAPLGLLWLAELGGLL